MNGSVIQSRFEALAAVGDDELNLAEAALVLAAGEYPELDVSVYLKLLNQYADEVTATLPNTDEPSAVLAHIRQYLFDAHGFAGNESNFYDPRNSFLNDVMDRKLGIPITLSVVYLEVAWRLGVPLKGVSLPGRFMVGLFEPDAAIILDPFGGGVRLDDGEIETKLEQMFGKLELDSNQLQRFLAPTSKREILVRMLRNLKAIYLAGKDFERALFAVDRMLVLEPEEPTEVRDRGLVLFHLNRVEAAREAWLHYLELAPQAGDVAQVAEWLQRSKPPATN